MLHLVFWLADRLPWLKGYIRRKEREVEAFLPMDAYGLEQYTAGECVRNLAALLSVLVLAFFLSNRLPGTAGGASWQRLVYLLACLPAAVAAASNRFDNWKLRQEKQLLMQLSDYLDEMRHAYYRSQDVEEAIYEAWALAGEEWKLHLAVMEEAFFEEGLPEAYQKNRPNSFFVTFLAVCQCAIRYGDRDGEDATSFLDNLEELQRSVQMELLNLEQEREAFLFIFPGMVASLLCLPVIERWSVAQIPELAGFYRSSAGSLIRIAICLVFLLSWRVFRFMKAGRWEEKRAVQEPSKGDTLTEQYVAKQDVKRRWSVKWFFLRLPLLWNQWEGRFGRWTGMVYRELKPEGSLELFYRRRVALLLTTALVGGLWCGFYRAGIGYLLLWLLAAVAAAFFPYVDLILAGDFNLHAREEEVSQFRSVLYLLSSVPQMTVEVILTWLEQFGYYYREPLALLLDQYGYPEEEAAVEEADKDQTGFFRILEDVAAADRVGVKEAFRDIVTKREFWRARSKQQQEMAVRKKEIYAQAVLFLPFGVAIGAYLILPFLYEGMKDLLSFVEMAR